jgi:TolA-binding protein
MFKRALVQEKAGKFERAALAFVEYQKEFPTDTNADRALYNAMLNYFKVARVEDAVTVGNQLLEKYPKSETISDVLADLGMTHESLARFDEAAAMYKRLAQTFPTDKRAAGALFNAAVLYKGIGKTDDSIVLLTDFNRRWPTHELSGDVSIELANLLEKSGRMVDAAKVYEEMARRAGNKPDLVMLAQAKVAVAKSSTKSPDVAWKDMERVASTLSAKDAPVAYEARNILAAGMFKLVEPSFAEFLAIKVTDGSKIEKQVAAKQNKLEVIADRFGKIIEIGSAEYVVASLYRLGEAHENFANALFKAPSPQGASQSDVDKFKTELEKVAFPLREEAYKFFETAYKRSKEVDTFTVWTRRTFQKMVDLSPDKHQEIDELSADPAYLSHDVKLIPAVAELIND